MRWTEKAAGYIAVLNRLARVWGNVFVFVFIWVFFLVFIWIFVFVGVMPRKSVGD